MYLLQLYKHNYDTEKVLKELVKKPTARNIIMAKQWSFNDSVGPLTLSTFS